MNEAIKKFIDWFAALSAGVASMTLSEAQAYLNFAIGLAALGWYILRFYTFSKTKETSE
jgi:hypothetical protein